MYTESEYLSLISRFEALTLPKSEWTHGAHLAVAIWYLWQHDGETAMNLTRKGITAHNEAVGTGNSDTEGYHETITRFWVQTTAKFMTGRSFVSPVDACNALMEVPEGQSAYPLEFYSREYLFTVDARRHWKEPDLKAIPLKSFTLRIFNLSHDVTKKMHHVLFLTHSVIFLIHELVRLYSFRR